MGGGSEKSCFWFSGFFFSLQVSQFPESFEEERDSLPRLSPVFFFASEPNDHLGSFNVVSGGKDQQEQQQRSQRDDERFLSSSPSSGIIDAVVVAVFIASRSRFFSSLLSGALSSKQQAP